MIISTSLFIMMSHDFFICSCIFISMASDYMSLAIMSLASTVMYHSNDIPYVKLMKLMNVETLNLVAEKFKHKVKTGNRNFC